MDHNRSTSIRRNRVRELRENRLMTQAQLARKAKVALRTIHSVEKGMNCRMDTKRKILLALGIESGGLWAIAADTDGIDGSENNAGAVLTPDSMRKNLDARAYLDRHDSYSFFRELGDLVVTGPTRTNVNDYRAILVTPA